MSQKGLTMNQRFQQMQEKSKHSEKTDDVKQPAAPAKEVYEDVDHIINTVIEEIWDEFDEDRGGTLDVDETHNFVKSTLQEMGEKPDYSMEDFNECFKYFQPGQPGVITKLEMRIFIKKIAGLDTKADEAADKEEKEREAAGD